MQINKTHSALTLLTILLISLIPGIAEAGNVMYWIDCEDSTEWSITYPSGNHGTFFNDSQHVESNWSVCSNQTSTGPHGDVVSNHVVMNITDLPNYDYWIQYHLYVRAVGTTTILGPTPYSVNAPIYLINWQLALVLNQSGSGYNLVLGKPATQGTDDISMTITASNTTILPLATWYRIDIHYTPTTTNIFVNGSYCMHDNTTRANEKPSTFKICNYGCYAGGNTQFCTDYIVFSTTQEGVPDWGTPPPPPPPPPYIPPVTPGGTWAYNITSVISFMPALIVTFTPALLFGKYGGGIGFLAGFMIGVVIASYYGFLPFWLIYLMALGISIFAVTKLRGSGGGGEDG